MSDLPIALPAAWRPFLTEAATIWKQGGWGMFALAFNGIIMFAIGSSLALGLLMKGLFLSPDRAWRRYQRGAARGRRPAGTGVSIIRQAMTCRSLADMEHYFEAVRNSTIYPFERNLKVMSASVAAAPLLGLLGTVTGMLETFDALATGGGGDKTMGMVAGGISEALVTTMTGLVFALAGLAFQAALSKQHEGYDNTVTHLQTLCMQHYRQSTTEGGV